MLFDRRTGEEARVDSVCVFCGSATGADGRYRATAAALGSAVARRGLTLVYGGASVGLMGVLADAALEAGGRVVGVIPSSLVSRELAHHRVADLRVVASMHERKSLMATLSDAFVALPGGVGTLDELFEMLTWTHLGFHAKPAALLDPDGYFEALVTFLDRAVHEGFVQPFCRRALLVERDADLLLDRVAALAGPAPADAG
jgi:hypothetical protein